MTRDYASLQRKPFLTPIWLSVLGAMAVMSMFAFAVWVWGTADSTTVIVIRHAEKKSNAGPDPSLTPEGESRALLLSQMFGNDRSQGHIDAIYVSPTVRSRMTAAPLAARLGITPAVTSDDPRQLARRVLREHAGGRVLVVSHADTMTTVVEALSGARHLPPVAAEEYGALYVVSVPRIGRANVLRMSY